MIKTVLGIDVGGSKIAAGLVDKRLKVSSVIIVPTSKTALYDQIERIIRSFKDFQAIGLGLPGQVLDSGIVNKLGNVKNWQAVNLRIKLEKKYKISVNVMNDAKAFALAEARVGSGKNFKTVAGVTLGTGIGVGIVMGGKVYFGADGVASEFGQFPMLDGKVFEKHVQAAGTFRDGSDARKYLKLLISFIVLSFNPQVIVLGGGWSKLPRLRQVVKKALGDLVYGTKTKVFISKLSHAGIIGAALPLLKK